MPRPRLRHLPWLRRILLIWLMEGLTFGLLTLLIPGLSFQTKATALLVAAGIGLVNAMVRPTLVRFGISPSLVVFWMATFGLNLLSLSLVKAYVAGTVVSHAWIAGLVCGLMTGVNVSFSDLFAIDDEDSYYQHLLSHIADLQPKGVRTSKPGVVFLEIDGLAERILQRAMQEGYMPTLAGWQLAGTHKVLPWECDVPCQTSASQTGILLGSNFDIPAFRWYEKDRGRTMVSSRPLDAAELERRLSRGTGLLVRNGASRANLVSGDAPKAIFTFSTLSDMTRHSTQDYYPLFMGPYNVLRMALLFIWDILAELRMASYQRRHDVKPRIHRGGAYPVLRAFTTILMRELSSLILIGDLYSGVPSVYATFFGYDEVAHHSGIEEPDALAVLKDLDEVFNRLEKVAKKAPRPYHFVILSDHGQSQGGTFKQRYSMTLEGLVRSLISDDQTVEGVESVDAAWGHLSIFLTDTLHDIISGDNHLASRLLRRAMQHRMHVDEVILKPLRDSLERQRSLLEREVIAPSREALERQRAKVEEALAPYRAKFEQQRTYLEQVVIGPYREQIEHLAETLNTKPSDVVVLASGNLGLIYFTQWKERMSYEQIEEAFPDLLKGLAGHEGIGFALVRSDEHGPLVIGAQGMRFLEGDRVEGQDPLANFGSNAAAHLRRIDSFPHVADIMVNSLYDPGTGEVAAFEELVGSHGGLGGDQMWPFVMFPADWDVEKRKIVGASQLHTQLKSWLEQVSPA